eukprot:3785426-Amphidinium_carterae.1
MGMLLIEAPLRVLASAAMAIFLVSYATSPLNVFAQLYDCDGNARNCKTPDLLEPSKSHKDEIGQKIGEKWGIWGVKPSQKVLKT